MYIYILHENNFFTLYSNVDMMLYMLSKKDFTFFKQNLKKNHFLIEWNLT